VIITKIGGIEIAFKRMNLNYRYFELAELILITEISTYDYRIYLLVNTKEGFVKNVVKFTGKTDFLM
jgi:hypothetical protein